MPLSAEEIIRKTENLLRGKSSYTLAKMRVTTPLWTVEYKLKSWEKGKDRTLILILSPPKDRGTTFLKLKYTLKMYIPRVNRVILIPPGMMGQPMLGSDFSYDDLVHETSITTDYSARITGESVIDGVKCKEITLTPRPGHPVVYGKLLYYVGADFIPRKIRFISKKGVELKTMFLSEIKKLGGRRIPTYYLVKNLVKKGRKTEYWILDAKFDIPIPDSLFTEMGMKRIK